MNGLAAVFITTSSSVPSWIGPVLAALVAAGLGFIFAQRQKQLEMKREACAKALSDALAWLELPYRIRRRSSDDPNTRTVIVDRIHSLQEALIFHDSWLLLTVPSAVNPYRRLVSKVKAVCLEPMRSAWNAPAINSGAQMNIGSLGIQPVVDEVTAFVDAVRTELRWWHLF
jgi:hypothetical protein